MRISIFLTLIILSLVIFGIEHDVYAADVQSWKKCQNFLEIDLSIEPTFLGNEIIIDLSIEPKNEIQEGEIDIVYVVRPATLTGPLLHEKTVNIEKNKSSHIIFNHPFQSPGNYSNQFLIFNSNESYFCEDQIFNILAIKEMDLRDHEFRMADKEASLLTENKTHRNDLGTKNIAIVPISNFDFGDLLIISGMSSMLPVFVMIREKQKKIQTIDNLHTSSITRKRFFLGLLFEFILILAVLGSMFTKNLDVVNLTYFLSFIALPLFLSWNSLRRVKIPFKILLTFAAGISSYIVLNFVTGVIYYPYFSNELPAIISAYMPLQDLTYFVFIEIITLPIKIVLPIIIIKIYIWLHRLNVLINIESETKYTPVRSKETNFDHITNTNVKFIEQRARTDIFKKVLIKNFHLRAGDFLKIHPGAMLEVKGVLLLSGGGIIENNGIIYCNAGTILNDGGLLLNNGVVINHGSKLGILKLGMIHNNKKSVAFEIKNMGVSMVMKKK